MGATAWFEKVGEFHVGFVDGHLFDGRARVAHDMHDFAGFFAVEIDAGRDENAVRAETSGGGAGHGGADAEFPGLVTGGANDAAASGSPAADVPDGGELRARRRISDARRASGQGSRRL